MNWPVGLQLCAALLIKYQLLTHFVGLYNLYNSNLFLDKYFTNGKQTSDESTAKLGRYAHPKWNGGQPSFLQPT